MKKANATKFNLKCVYTGRRWNGEKVIQRFETSDGKEHFFSGVVGVWIGYTYTCSNTQIKKRPDRIEVEPIHNPKWEAEDALVDKYLAKKRADMKARQVAQPAVKKAVEALLPLSEAFTGYWEIRSLVEVLVDEVMKKRKLKKVRSLDFFKAKGENR